MEAMISYLLASIYKYYRWQLNKTKKLVNVKIKDKRDDLANLFHALFAYQNLDLNVSYQYHDEHRFGIKDSKSTQTSVWMTWLQELTWDLFYIQKEKHTVKKMI